MPTTYFYSTPLDILRLCEAVEADSPIIYAQAGEHACSTVDIYSIAKEIPGFGISPTGDHLEDPGYLVQSSASGLDIKLERLPIQEDSFIYMAGLQQNPQAIHFVPGGSYGESCLIEGNFGTGTKSKVAAQLNRLFRHHIEQLFMLVNTHYLSPEAMELFKTGGRLTQAARGSHVLDFYPEPRTE